MSRPQLSRFVLPVALAAAAACAAACAASPAAPGTPRPLTRELKALMPEGATGLDGNWNSAGSLVSGSIRAEVAGTRGCDHATAKGYLLVEFVGRGRQPEALAKITRQGDDKWLEDAKLAMEDKLRSLPRNNSLHLDASPLKDEVVPSGRLVYFDHTSSCVATSSPSHTEAEVKALARAGRMVLRISISDECTAPEARALAAGIMARAARTNFSGILK